MNGHPNPFHAVQPRRGACRILMPILLAIVAGAAVAQPAADGAMAREFDDALAAYDRNHWPDAYRAMSALAARGHPEAARIALQMWRHGPALYGRTFSADAAQVDAWTQLWVCAGGATGRACEIALRTP